MGDLGKGTLTVADGGHVSVGNGIVHVAEAATANGVVNIGAAAGSAPVGAGTLGAAEVRFGDGTGRLNFNHTDSAYLFSPVITGNGALNHYSGTTILTGNNIYSGSTMIAGGVLQLGNGGTSGSVTSDIQIDSTGTLRIDRSNDWTYAGILSGTGVFDQLGTGTTMLTGNSAAFNGTTTVTNGRLIVGMGGSGALGGTIDVLNGATLGGSGTAGSTGADVTILGGGVHAPGNSVGVQTIAGNYVNYGTLRIDGTPAGTDMLIVQGGVDITGATLDLQLSPPVASGWNIINGPFTIIDKQSAGAVAGSFGAVNNNLLFLDPYVNYAGGDGNDITLDFVRNDVASASVALTPNQIATGRGIDMLPYGHPIWNTIALMSDEVAVRRSFDFLSGEIHATASGVLLEESRFPRRAVNDRLRSAFGTNTDTAFWAHGYGAWAGWQSDGNAASLKRDTGGLLLGLDGQLGNWRAGVMTGRSWTGVTVADRASTAEAGTWYAGLYGGTQWGDLGLRLGLLHGEHDIDTRRTVAVPGLSGALRSTHGASTTQAFGELAHTLHFGIVRYEPFANLAHIHTRSNRFTETGGSMALAGRRSTMSATVMTLGQRIEAAHVFRGTGIRTVGMIGWQHVWGDVIPRSTHRFSMGDPFTIAGTPLARNNLLVEGGFELSLGRRAAIGASYTGRFAHNGHDHAATAVLRIGF
ncbi:autotransporter outer membrane beta-barrel domain-containing protein [Nitrosomonas europaea]|uniref:autotransporter outer membrane beta-barrel domain-containing protein n=1 Tax=Nitrosomonas europaea TaxID=915 RepID=UPI003CD0D693